MSTFEFKKPLWTGGSLADKYGKFDFSDNANTEPETNEDADKKGKGGGNAADIISASAEGVNALSGLISGFMGNNQGQQGEAPPPPPPQEGNNNLFIIGGFGIATLIIIFLITRSNGTAKQ